METYDPTQHHMAAGAVRARLDAGAVRDEKGYFRVRPGQSTLREKARATRAACARAPRVLTHHGGAAAAPLPAGRQAGDGDVAVAQPEFNGTFR